MHPLVRTAVVAAVFTALGSLARDETDDADGSQADSGPELPAACGPRTVPEGTVCVPIPSAGAPLAASAAEPRAEPGKDAWIPRRPERQADYTAYRFPLEARSVVPASGGVALELATIRGAPVAVAVLENQQGDAEVAFVGNLFGSTAVTKHLVHEGGRDRGYLVILGYLGRLEPTVTVGAHLAAGASIGVVGDGPAGTRAQLHLEIRRIRDGAAVDKLDAAHVRDASVSVPIDARNVLAPAK